IADGLEHGHNRSVLYILITSGLIQLMRAETRARSRRIRLDADALIQQPLFIKLCQDPPKGFYIIVFEGDIGMLEVDPITHPAGELIPFVLVFQYFPAAGLVIFGNRDLFSYIFLSDTEHLFNS